KEQPEGLHADWQTAISRIEAWVTQSDEPTYGTRADALIAEIHALEPDATSAWTWREMIMVNLAGRLVALVTAHRNAFYLANLIAGSGPVDKPVVDTLLD